MFNDVRIKARVTNKELAAHYQYRIVIPNDMLNRTMRFIGQTYYTAGAYGWNADVYQFDYNTVFIRGYRPHGNIIPSRAMLDEFQRSEQYIYDKYRLGRCDENEYNKVMLLLIDRLVECVLKSEGGN